MLHRILAADIEYDRQLWLHCNDVRKVLIGADTQIDAAGLRFLEILDDVLKRRLIGHEVVGSEVAAGFGEVREEAPEGFVAELRRNRLARTRAECLAQWTDEHEERRDGNEKNATANCQHEPILTESGTAGKQFDEAVTL